VQPNIVLNELWELMSYTTPKSTVVACAVGQHAAATMNANAGPKTRELMLRIATPPATKNQLEIIKRNFCGSRLRDLWIRNWRNKHPTNSVFDGAVAFIIEMRANAVWGNADRQ
jgi:hypothetical protein